MIKFIKYEGCGNDYIYIDCFEQIIKKPKELAKMISDRNFGVGSDGLILILPSNVSDARIRIFNSDGSEAEMCGNGIRCAAKYIFEKEKFVLRNKENITIETLAGIKKLKIIENTRKTSIIETDMSLPIFEYKKIPFDIHEYLKDYDYVLFSDNKIVNKPLKIRENIYNMTCVSIGNPHAVFFVKKIFSDSFETIAKEIQKLKYFPESVNVSFAKIYKDEKEIDVLVYERGSGQTLACGTGACACVASAIVNNFFKKNDEIKVNLRGGSLIVKITNETIFLTGPATKVFEGKF